MSLCIEVKPGYYVTIAEATGVFEDVASESEERHTMPAGVWLHVVETMLIAKENRIRGKLAQGGWIVDMGDWVELAEDGWISIVNTANDTWWVKRRAHDVR